MSLVKAALKNTTKFKTVKRLLGKLRKQISLVACRKLVPEAHEADVP